MRVSWILMPGYFAVPTSDGQRQPLEQRKVDVYVQPLGLESGEAASHREQFFAHRGEMVQALLQTEAGQVVGAGDDALGEVRLGGCGCAKTGGAVRGALDGLDDRGEGVAENHGAPGAEVVNVSVAVGVGEVGALRALDEGRRAAYCAKGPDRGVDAAGEEMLGALLEGLGAGAVLGWEWRGHGGFSIEGGYGPVWA